MYNAIHRSVFKLKAEETIFLFVLLCSVSIFLELPVPVVEGTDLPGLQPPGDAVEVEGVVTHPPGHSTLLASGAGLECFYFYLCRPTFIICWIPKSLSVSPDWPGTRCRGPWCGCDRWRSCPPRCPRPTEPRRSTSSPRTSSFPTEIRSVSLHSKWDRRKASQIIHFVYCNINWLRVIIIISNL